MATIEKKESAKEFPKDFATVNADIKKAALNLSKCVNTDEKAIKSVFAELVVCIQGLISIGIAPHINLSLEYVQDDINNMNVVMSFVYESLEDIPYSNSNNIREILLMEYFMLLEPFVTICQHYVEFVRKENAQIASSAAADKEAHEKWKADAKATDDEYFAEIEAKRIAKEAEAEAKRATEDAIDERARHIEATIIAEAQHVTDALKEEAERIRNMQIQMQLHNEKPECCVIL